MNPMTLAGRRLRLSGFCPLRNSHAFNRGLLCCGALLASARLASAQAAPASFSSTITNSGSSVTVDFVKHPIRSSNFSVLVQNSSGALTPYTAPEARTYFGTVQGYPGAIAAGTLKPNGTVLARIYFENGVEWISSGGGTATTRGSATYTKANPGFTVTSAAGGDVRVAELGIDSAFGHYNRNGNVNDTLYIIEHSVMTANLAYLRDAALLHRLGRVVIRTSQTHDPYNGLTGGGLLGEIKNQWNNVLPASTHDVAAGLYAGSVGGGLAWVGAIGSANRYSVNDSDSNGDFSVIWRHEVGHNWGANHYEGNTPDGPTIMSGNSLSRFSSPELAKVLDHRTAKLGILDSIGAYPFPLPPRASLDMVHAPVGGTAVVNVLANDSDSNGNSISILSFDATSNLGGTVSQVAGGLQIQNVAAHGQRDWFNYRIQDSTGRTATGIVYVTGESPSSKLTGTGIGTPGSWNNQGNTLVKALDGNLTTWFSAPQASGDWVGLDLGAATSKVLTKVRYCPRSGFAGRMTGGQIQGSNTADFSSGVVTLATVESAPSSNMMTVQLFNNSTPYRYVRYLSPDNGFCDIAEIEFWGTVVPSKLTGTGIGTPGSYYGPDTFDKALDGNLATFYDADSASGDWTGLDLGASNTKVISQVRVAPRNAYHAPRMVGGQIQASNTADFSSGVVTLATITSAPPAGVLTTLAVPIIPGAYRYVRYLGPNNGWCNLAEIEFWGGTP